LPLAAAARAGRGRVLAFGDTSSFQNLAFAHSWPFVHRCFAWLAGGRERGSLTAWVSRGCALALLLLAACWARRRGARWALVVAALAVGFGLGRHAVLWRLATTQGETIQGQRLALIDVGHHNRLSLVSTGETGLFGLANSLARNGLLPRYVRTLSPAMLRSAKALILIAPQVPYSTDEIRAMERFMSRGGRVIVTAGYPEYPPLKHLLGRWGMRVLGVPLGSGQAMTREKWQAHTCDAWRLSADPPAELVLTRLGLPCAYQRSDRGQLFVIADSQFLLNRNLEGMGNWNIDNIAFLQWMLTDKRMPQKAYEPEKPPQQPKPPQRPRPPQRPVPPGARPPAPGPQPTPAAS
jgi:hypothetical protein